MFKQICKTLQYAMRGADVGFLVLVVGQACTLRCKDCANFSPYADQSRKAYDIEKTLNDLHNVVNSVWRIRKLQIQGGEPFVYPYLNKILEYVVHEDKIKEVDIATNGTVIPYNFFDYLKNKKVNVRISDYPVVSEEKMQKLCNEFERQGVAYTKYEFVGKDGLWRDSGGVDTKREDNGKKVSSRFRLCSFRGCWTLENGIIGRCSRSTHSLYIQKFQTLPKDYIQVRGGI